GVPRWKISFELRRSPRHLRIWRRREDRRPNLRLSACRSAGSVAKQRDRQRALNRPGSAQIPECSRGSSALNRLESFRQLAEKSQSRRCRIELTRAWAADALARPEGAAIGLERSWHRLCIERRPQRRTLSPQLRAFRRAQ